MQLAKHTDTGEVTEKSVRDYRARAMTWPSAIVIVKYEGEYYNSFIQLNGIGPGNMLTVNLSEPVRYETY